MSGPGEPVYVPPVVAQKPPGDPAKKLAYGGTAAAGASLCCPIIGQAAAVAVTLAAQNKARTAGTSLGRLPLINYLIAAAAFMLFVPLAIISAVTAPEEDKVSSGGTTIAPTAPPSTVATVEQSLEQLVDRIRIAPESKPRKYDRKSFDYPDGGEDQRGCDTRQRVLIRDSLDLAQVDPSGCRVIAGRWADPYTGREFTAPEDVSIDHVVALAEAWDSGAASWDKSRRVTFANDVDHVDTLVVIGGAGNAEKGDKDPAAWAPPDPARVHDYLTRWAAVKVRWDLSADQAEVDAIRRFINPPPPETTVATTAPLGIASLPPTTTATTRSPAITAAPTTRPPAITPPPTTSSNQGEVNPGSYCSPEGATGYSKDGVQMTCSSHSCTGEDYGDRNRWRRTTC